MAALSFNWIKPSPPVKVSVKIEFDFHIMAFDVNEADEKGLKNQIVAYYHTILKGGPALNIDYIERSQFSLRPILTDPRFIVQASFPPGPFKHLLLLLNLKGEKKYELRYFSLTESDLGKSFGAWCSSNVHNGEVLDMLDFTLASLFLENSNVARFEINFLRHTSVFDSVEYRRHLYDTEFLGKEFAFKGLMEYVKSAHECFQNNHTIAPYFAIVQSSGTGKTRLVIEASRENLYRSLYIFCRETQGCSPSPFVVALEERLRTLSSSSSSRFAIFQDMVSFAWTKLWRALVKINEEWRKAELSQSDATKSSNSTSSISYPINMDDVTTVMAGVYVEAEWEEKQKEFWADIISLPDSAPIPNIPEWLPSIPVVITFDEARGLNQMYAKVYKDEVGGSLIGYDPIMVFRIIRRALAEIHKRLEGRVIFCGIFLDTSSKVANFLPPSQFDPSGRPDSGSKGLLLCPMDYASEFDLFIETDGPIEKLITDRMSNEKKRIQMLMAGRPLWNNMKETFENPNSTARVPPNMLENKLLDGALSKLGHGLKVQNPDYDENGLLWKIIPIVVRVSPRLAGSAVLATDMVSNYMAYLYSCSSDRKHIRAVYREEPILGAALSKYFPKNHELVNTCLIALRDYMTEFSGDTGFYGEFATQLLMIAAMDHASSAASHVGCNLQNFIDSLAGCSVSLPKAVTNAKLAFVQFIETQSLFIGPKHIERALRLCYAISASHANKGFDLLLPFEREDGFLGCLLVEVKNHRSGKTKVQKPSSDAFRKMNDQIMAYREMGYQDTFGLIISLGQFNVVNGKLINPEMYVLDPSMTEEEMSAGIKILIGDTNTWKNPTQGLATLQYAAQSLRISDETLKPKPAHPIMTDIIPSSDCHVQIKKINVGTLLMDETNIEPT